MTLAKPINSWQQIWLSFLQTKLKWTLLCFCCSRFSCRRSKHKIRACPKPRISTFSSVSFKNETLQWLDKYGVKASLIVDSMDVQNNAGFLKLAVSKGHTVGIQFARPEMFGSIGSLNVCLGSSVYSKEPEYFKAINDAIANAQKVVPITYCNFPSIPLASAVMLSGGRPD